LGELDYPLDMHYNDAYIRYDSDIWALAMDRMEFYKHCVRDDYAFSYHFKNLIFAVVAPFCVEKSFMKNQYGYA
jgi:hypothetical protein